MESLMDRRNALKWAAAASMTAAAGLRGNQYREGEAEAVKMEGGWQYKELEYEKHIPEVVVLWKEETAVVTMHVEHPQTAEHHISTFKIYDENRIEITEFNLHPEMSQPRASFYLRVPKGTKLIATSDCNIHGIWMKPFKV